MANNEVTLTGAVRASLLALNNTTDLIDRTQNRLSTGLKVASAIDDAVAYFQAKGLNDRAQDFTEKKDSIDQGLSTLTAATDGIDAIDSLVRQLKGIMQSMKSASGATFTDLVSQFNDKRTQIGLLADDAEYQGTNLINNTTETLEVQFSNETASAITVNAVNVRESGLGINTLAAANSQSFSYSAYGTNTLGTGESLTLTFKGTTLSLAASDAALTFTVGTVSLSLVGNTQAAVALENGDTVVVKLGTTVAGAGPATNELAGIIAASATIAVTSASTTDYVVEGDANTITSVINTLDSALSTLRTQAQSLGSNVALLQTRLDFTESYVNTLETGAAKLTVADMNEEGANLLALQTRQQLGIQSLAFAGQADQSILSLFG